MISRLSCLGWACTLDIVNSFLERGGIRLDRDIVLLLKS